MKILSDIIHKDIITTKIISLVAVIDINKPAGNLN